MDVPVTLSVATAAFLFPSEEWLTPVLISNSVVGFVYMIAEEESLRNPGTKAFGRRWPIPSRSVGMLVNVITHVVVPLLLLRRGGGGGGGKRKAWKTVVLEVAGLCLVDLDNVYPTRRSILPYAVAHVILVLLLLHPA